MVIRRTSGEVVELSTVWVGASAKPRRPRKKGSTSAQKRDENERDAVKRLARIINCNFSHGDLLLTPNYDQAGMARLEEWARANQMEGESWEDAMLRGAKREGKLYLERIKPALKAKGVVCKYVLITSDMDGETGELVRLHHHLVIQRVGYEVAAAKWPFGSVDYQILKDQDDYTPLALYLCKQVRHQPDAKKWTASRNMAGPVVSTRWASAGEELRPDSRAVLVDRNQWERGKPQYIRFIKRPLPSERQKAERGREFPDSLRGRAGATSMGTAGTPPKGGAG